MKMVRKIEQNYPIASSEHKHGDIVKCPNCGAIGRLDCSPNEELEFENGIWEYDKEWFCIECCVDKNESE
jgi:hypothetical protein